MRLMHPKAYAEDLLPYKAITLQAFFLHFHMKVPHKTDFGQTFETASQFNYLPVQALVITKWIIKLI